MYDDSDEQMYGSWGLDDEKCLDDCNFPPRIGRQGVKGCKAVCSNAKCKVTIRSKGLFGEEMERIQHCLSLSLTNRWAAYQSQGKSWRAKHSYSRVGLMMINRKTINR